MKNYQVFLILLLCISLTSCKTTIANPGKPLIESSIEVGRTYEVQDFNAKVFNLKITDFDKDCIYGISSKNTQIIIDRSSIRQMKKWEVSKSIILGVLAVAVVIFVPI
ncbi:bacteriophage spanin2 family protein [Elizabethkingia meningoseptica]|uniref:bacteriophage spanin2 family protein n=1 Tax=Elizabethkingia meningoseptica TaxID=238 RepID=UPI0022F17F95|nr:bacteriophage spanin2 family protein [Elizabethkingia meningoseptica]EJK5328064.1 bacteriophage spanin2 family protein [Elizabethkingia meningoseptica]WBS74173.1 bacteriophage spanin2 family protein [Elizabethkingia meningoseptica]